MTTVAMNASQQAQLQGQVQAELEKREWAEPGDSVMAEYITVLITNGNDRDRVHTEMDDLVGADFDPGFLSWLFNTASSIQQASEPSPVAPTSTSAPATAAAARADGGSRILNNALSASRQDTYSTKRKADQPGPADAANKRRISEGAAAAAPSGPRAMSNEGRSLQSRISGRPMPMAVRGMAQRPMSMQGQSQGQQRGQELIGPAQGQGQMGFQARQPVYPNMFPPGQQEMMAQMMMMQASMAQMGEMMNHMITEKEKAQAQAQQPAYKAPPKETKIPHGTKLGSHSVSAVPPKASTGPIPTKPSSTQLCKFSFGCTNSRCIYSHPSPAADEKTGMVLSDEPCPAGKDCKDADCIKGHVSPAVAFGEKAGPSRMLCKYQNCTNPACPFRHEDAEGNAVPAPALTKAKSASTVKPKVAPVDASSDNEDGDIEVVMTSKSLLDGPLDDTKKAVPCRYGERCTRADCRFSHPASRKPVKGSTKGAGMTGMTASKKFGLNVKAGEFVPQAPST